MTSQAPGVTTVTTEHRRKTREKPAPSPGEPASLPVEKVVALANYDRATKCFEILAPGGAGKRLFFIPWGVMQVREGGPLTVEVLRELFANAEFVKLLRQGTIHAVTNLSQLREDLLPKEGLFAEKTPPSVRDHIQRVRATREDLARIAEASMSRYTHAVLHPEESANQQ